MVRRLTAGGANRLHGLRGGKNSLYGVAVLLTAVLVNQAWAETAWLEPVQELTALPLIREDSSPEIRFVADRDDDEDEEGNNFEPYLEEVFLGFVIYPQEQGEVQLTWGYFDHVETNHDALFLFEVEYGITDRFQIGVEVPVDFMPEDSFDGVQNIGLELYWNFYSNPQTGRGYGIGFEIGFPTDAPAGESRAYIYEPFVVAYQDFQTFAVNISGAVEVENPLEPGEPSETSGELAAAVFGPVGRFTPMLEVGVEIEADETPVRLAPGLYWSPCDKPVDFAVALPIGLNRDAPDFGVFLLAIIEFETKERCPRLY
jgi:hypothetical protein